AVNPRDGRMVVIEMNPRVSRSSALASKATGFPIAKIAAKLALGYHLDEIPNDITRLTPASFEPTIDYVVVKIPRWNFEKFPQADRTLTTQMKSVGEVMAIGRTFKEAFMKGVRSLELGRSGLLFAPSNMDDEDDAGLRKRLAVPNDRRLWDLFRALGRGWTVDHIHELTKIDPWFLRQFEEIAAMRRSIAQGGLGALDARTMLQVKRAGLGDEKFETVMINCNPETVSTDYDTSDRLYFQPLTFEDVMAVIETERSAGAEVTCLVQFGGQTPLKLALALQEAGVKILGTSPD